MQADVYFSCLNINIAYGIFSFHMPHIIDDNSRQLHDEQNTTIVLIPNMSSTLMWASTTWMGLHYLWSFVVYSCAALATAKNKLVRVSTQLWSDVDPFLNVIRVIHHLLFNINYCKACNILLFFFLAKKHWWTYSLSKGTVLQHDCWLYYPRLKWPNNFIWHLFCRHTTT